MKTKFNFNSQICTTREQSERLLALGIKKETADMYWTKPFNEWIAIVGDCNADEDNIPAWSLHRLIELRKPNTIDNAVVVLPREQTYDNLIGKIAKSIKIGYFNKEYLNEITKD